MSKRKVKKVEPTAETIAIIRQDYPTALKLKLRLLLSGGRQVKRLCHCGAEGVHCQAFLPPGALGVESVDKGIRVFWQCAACHEQTAQAGLQGTIWVQAMQQDGLASGAQDGR